MDEGKEVARLADYLNEEQLGSDPAGTLYVDEDGDTWEKSGPGRFVMWWMGDPCHVTSTEAATVCCLRRVGPDEVRMDTDEMMPWEQDVVPCT